MDKVGVRCTTYTFGADIDNDTFQAEFDKINENPDIDGILMLRPLPKQLDEKQIENKIDPRKDLDGISPLNLAKVYAGDESGYAPCTAEAVIEMLDYAGIDIRVKGNSCRKKSCYRKTCFYASYEAQCNSYSMSYKDS